MSYPLHRFTPPEGVTNEWVSPSQSAAADFHVGTSEMGLPTAAESRSPALPITGPDEKPEPDQETAPDTTEEQRARTLAKLHQLCRMPETDPQRARLREEVISEYMSYARFLAGRYCLHGDAARDLVQAAYVGLVKAVDNYDLAFDTTFLTYATPMITGEMKRHFRDTTWDVHVPRRMQELSGQLRVISGELAQELGRSPTVDELAAHLDASVEDVVNAFEATRAYSTASLDVPVAAADGDGIVLGDLLGSEDPAIDMVVDREALKEALKRLTDREKRILLMRFFRNMTQSEIGSELGVSQMQVSRLL